MFATGRMADGVGSSDFGACLHPGYSRPLAWEVTGVLERGGVIKLPRARAGLAGAKHVAMWRC